MARFEIKRNTWLVGLSGLAALMLSTAVWADATATQIAPVDDSILVVVDDGSGDGIVAETGSDGTDETGVDTGSDGTDETGVDTGSDGGDETAVDTGSDGTDETGVDTGSDGGDETAVDTGSDGGDETAVDNGSDGDDETAVDDGSDGTDEVVVEDGLDDEAVTDTGVDDAVVDGTVIRDGSGDEPGVDTGLDGTGDTGVFVIDGWAGNGGIYYFTAGTDDPVPVYDLGEAPAVDDGSAVTEEPVVDEGKGDDVLLDEDGLPVLYAVDPIYTLDPDACIDCFVITGGRPLNYSAVERGAVAQFEDMLPTSSGSSAVEHDSSPLAADLCDPAVVSLLCELKTGTSN